MAFLTRNTLLTAWRRSRPRLVRWGLVAVAPGLLFLGLHLLFPLPVEKLHPPASTLVLARDGQVLRMFLAPDEMWRVYVTPEEIPEPLRQAVLAFEDRFFYRHFGVNPGALVRAAVANLRAGRIVQGGSTLTMQVARLMEPKARTYLNKLKEIFRALQLEWTYSKEEILTFYFNLAPYGGNLVGVGAASYLYFNKRPTQLSLGEAAILAALPNSPNRYRPDLNPEGARAAREKVLAILARRGAIDAAQHQAALSEPVPTRRFPPPFQAPHLSDWLVRQFGSGERFPTTIDPSIQALAERLLRNHLRPLQARGIGNGAVVVLENRTQAVRALVGSVDFFDRVRQGQVNGATAPRSPGSALKPFVYALGLQHGLVSPQSLLEDVPVEYAGYRPVNYDERYHGVVTVEQALVQSLNVPAVNLYARLGSNGVYQFLRRAGVSTLPKPKDYYGLSLILGGCEVTLLELTNLYAGLANGGRFRPYRLLETDPLPEGRALLDPGVCFILTEMLSQLRRPELPAVWEAAVNLPKVAWKTGTSYGHRDAWSVGYTPRYTVGVWVGNFDGRGVPELVGAETAAPLLFAVFNALLQNTDAAWFVQPPSVEMRQVCSVSGRPLGRSCTSAVDELYLPGVSPNAPCNLHQLIAVDLETGQRLCSRCRPGRRFEERLVTTWPAEVASWLARNGRPLDRIPEHYEKCPRITSGEAPLIKSPPDGAVYKIRPYVALAYQKIRLDAFVSNQTREIFWFVDGKLLYSGSPDRKVFLTPKRGRHTILCLDDEGRSSSVTIVVQ